MLPVNDFESKDAYWDFAKTVRSERRFIFDGKVGKFLAAVRVASKSRVRALKSGARLFRAQLGSNVGVRPTGDGEAVSGVEEELPLQEARMIPDPKYITRGG